MDRQTDRTLQYTFNTAVCNGTGTLLVISVDSRKPTVYLEDLVATLTFSFRHEIPLHDISGSRFKTLNRFVQLLSSVRNQSHPLCSHAIVQLICCLVFTSANDNSTHVGSVVK